MNKILTLCRPGQWIKNLLVFAGIIFAQKLSDINSLLLTLVSFIVFCLISSSVYIINDIADKEYDLRHPLKKHRPIADGTITVSRGLYISIFLFIISIVVSFLLLNNFFSCVLLIYFIMMMLYTFYLKNIVILDVIVIAVGFVIRAISGAVVINVVISPWLILCTFLLALFIALGKRRSEWILAEKQPGYNNRRSLQNYSAELLDQLISVVTASTLMAYSLYTFDARTIHTAGTENLPFTIPLVVYGIFRYLYLIYRKDLGEEPERLIFRDRSLLINILLWGVFVAVLIY